MQLGLGQWGTSCICGWSYHVEVKFTVTYFPSKIYRRFTSTVIRDFWVMFGTVSMFWSHSGPCSYNWGPPFTARLGLESHTWCTVSSLIFDRGGKPKNLDFYLCSHLVVRKLEFKLVHCHLNWVFVSCLQVSISIPDQAFGRSKVLSF